MKARGWGRVLNISSIFSLVTKERRLAYSTVKAGLNAMTRSLALELAPHNVLVNALCPGYVETALTRANNSPDEIAAIARSIPVGRLAQPAQVAYDDRDTGGHDRRVTQCSNGDLGANPSPVTHGHGDGRKR